MSNEKKYVDILGRLVPQQNRDENIWTEEVPTNNGRKTVTKFSVKAKNGIFVQITLWGDSAKFHGDSLEVGDLVYANGAYTQRTEKNTTYHNLSVSDITDFWSCRTEAARVVETVAKTNEEKLAEILVDEDEELPFDKQGKLPWE